MTDTAHQPDLTLLARSPADTEGLGRALGAVLPGGLTVALIGPLGAGKTALVRGIAAGNDPAGSPRVTSPTFTLINEYAGRLLLYHLDAYRLDNVDQLWALGFAELAAPDSAVVLEWADRVPSALPPDRLVVTITPTGETERRLDVVVVGPGAQQCLAHWRSAVDTLAGDI